MSKRVGTGWLTNIAPAALAVAGVMVVTGIYLIDPTIADLGFALQAERTAFPGAFLIFAGITLALAVAGPAVATGNTIIDLVLQLGATLTLLSVALIEILVGAQAPFADPRNDWAVLLLIPATLSFVFFLANLAAPTPGAEGEEEDANEEQDEPTTSQSGKVDVAADARFSAIYGLFYAVAMGAVLFWMAFAAWIYYRLKGAILHGETLDLAAAGETLSATMQNAWPMAVALAAMGAVLHAGAGLAPSLVGWFTNRGTPDANRDLTKEEVGFIISATRETETYAKAQGYDRNKWVIGTINFVAVMAGIGFGAVIAFAAIAVLETPAGPSFPIELRGGLSPVVFVFVGILLSVVPNALLTRLSRRYAERMGWVTIGEKDELHALKRHLTALVRAHRLSSTATFHPGDVLEAASQPGERFALVAAAALTVVGLFFFHRDLNTTDTLTAKEVEITDYWTLTSQRFAYTDVEQVAVGCFFTNKGEAVEAYELHLPGGHTLDLYKNAETFEAQIEAMEAIDAKLTAAGIPFVPGAHKGWYRGDERGYDTDCVNQVARAFPENLQERVRRFFHLETLAAAETIWPWHPELAKAALAGETYRIDESLALYTKEIDSGKLTPHLLAVAYAGRAAARENYETAHGIRDAQMLLVLSDYQKASAIEPTINTYRGEAFSYIALGAYDEALAAYRQALTLDKPKPHWSLIGLARVERIRGRTDAAMRHLDQVLAVWGEDDASMPIFYHRARVLYLKGDDAGVIEAITKGLRYQADYPDAFRYRACAHARRGAFDKAREDIEQAIKHATTPPLDEVWEKTPYARAYHAAHASDHAIIQAMAAGTASEADRANLCRPLANHGEDYRPRSPLLPVQ